MVLGAGLLIAVMGLGTRSSFGVFLKSLEGEFNISRSASSTIFSVYMLVCCGLAVLGGWASDRYGPAKVSFLMGCFTGLSLLLSGLTDSPWQLFVTYGLLLALGTGPIYTVVNSTASRWFKQKRGFAIGITSSGGGLGTIIIAPFATYLISRFGWRMAFMVLGFVTWVTMACASLLLKKDPRDMGLLSDGRSLNIPRTDRHESSTPVESPEYSLRQAYRTRQFWLLGFTWLLLSLGLHLVLIHVVPYAVDAGISPMEAAIILSLIGAANLPGRLVVGRLSDIMGRKALAILCTLAEAASLVWLMEAQELWTFYTFGVVFGLLWAGTGTTSTALVGDVFGLRDIGVIMGLMSAGWSLGAAVGPAIGGTVYDLRGGYFMAFAAGAAALLLAAILISLIGKIDGRQKTLFMS